MRSFFLICFFLVFFKPITGDTEHVHRTEPWLVNEAIAYLDNYLDKNPHAVILEFGSGASTIWFAQRTPNLYSIEHSTKYYELTLASLIDADCYDVDYQFSTRPYYHLCGTFPDEFFDLILVDGRNRKGCIVRAIPKLKPGGVLMLDNSERKHYHSVFSLMEGWEHFSAEQTGPDKFGYWYFGWKTDWWIKPKK